MMVNINNTLFYITTIGMVALLVHEEAYLVLAAAMVVGAMVTIFFSRTR